MHRSIDLKLFELDTKCPLVTLGDRAEPVVAHLDCDQFQVGRAVMAHGKMRTTGRACQTVENSMFTFGCSSSGARVHWRAQASGEFLSRNLSATWSQ